MSCEIAGLRDPAGCGRGTKPVGIWPTPARWHSSPTV